MAKSEFKTGDLWKWGLGLGVAALGYVAYDYFVHKPAIAKKAFTKNDIYSRQAIAFRNGMNPSGNAPMMAFDGTNELQLIKVAKQVKDFNKVSDSYYNMYNSNLANDVQSELSSSELNTFYRVLKQNKK